ncbi:MAG: hypothetical protein JNM50_01915 [Chromatiales bacterium]|jgi:hypothetical protein|nr:hypothetical protein [Chromatiales bacterium]
MKAASSSPVALRWLAALLLAAVLHALALPAAGAATVGDPAEHCGDCHVVPDDPCFMSPVGEATADGPASVSRDRFHPPHLASVPVLLVLRGDVDATDRAPAPLLASGAARSGRATGDPPRHLRLGRLRN